MCGIAGICRLADPAIIPFDRMARMVGALAHRGPDEAGVYRDPWAMLGHSRLSIVDLSGGTQPIHNEDGSLWITYNGEVYNHPELRQALEAKGHRFYTHSDTEVILHLYEEEGPSCLQHLNGQFALGIWDARKRTLFLARDRLGVRPLHYALHDGELVFASEAKAIFAGCEIPRRLDAAALDQIFTLWTTLPGETAFEGVKELPPGHYAMLAAGRLVVTKYWSPPFRRRVDLVDTAFEDLRGEVQRLLSDAVRVRLRADVTVGTYVSGGLDSSAVTAFAADACGDRLRTFGIRFEHDRFDEGVYQRLMADTYGLDHHDVIASDAAIAHALPDAVWHCEKPLLRTAPVPMYLLSAAVRDHGIKVVLTGEGSDEFFGGYDIFREAGVRRFMARAPDSAWRPRLLERLYPDVFRDPAARRGNAAFFGRDLDNSDDPLFSHRIRWDGMRRMKVLFSSALSSRIGRSDVIDRVRSALPAQFETWPALSRAQHLEITYFLSNYLLSSQGDRVGMAHSVEARMPFLDHRLIELMAGVRPTWKMLGTREKHLLKRSLDGVLPAAIVRREKTPYRAPVSEVLLHDSAQPMMRDLLSDSALRDAGLFAPDRIGLLLKKAARRGSLSEFESMALAGVVSAQLLHRQYVNEFPRRVAAPAHFRLCIDRLGAAASGAMLQ